MPKIVSPLTVTRINNTKPGEKVIKLSDGAGLALWVMPTGKKVWRIQYQRPADKKLDTLTIGPYPEVSLASAREQRDIIRADIAAKNNPKLAAQRRQLTKSDTALITIATQWHDRWKKDVTANYASQVWRVLETNVFPMLGGMPINEIAARHIVESLRPMEARGTLEYLRRAKNTVNQIFTFALACGLVDNNVAAGISGAFETPKKSNFRALKPAELPILLSGIQSDRINIQTRHLIMWQLLTLARPAEAATARWDEIQDEQWIIPAEKMKRRREHIVPLSSAAIAILDGMRPISGHREFIFPSRTNPKTHGSTETANAALKRLGIATTSHGLRALASTTLHEADFDSRVIETALAHADQNETRAAYNRALYLAQRREMLEWWASHISKSTPHHQPSTDHIK